MLTNAGNNSSENKGKINKAESTGRLNSGFLDLLDSWRHNSETGKGRIPLPPEFYSSREILDMEVEKVFKKEDTLNFCKYCGAKITEELSICPECGEQLN